jgi:hypothetical protein
MGATSCTSTREEQARSDFPLVPAVVPIVDRWSAGKTPDGGSSPPAGGPRRRTGSGRSDGVAKATIGRRAADSRSAPYGGFSVAGIWR